MGDDSIQRKLTSIMTADVAGYSRLMAIDEEGTLRALKSHVADLIEPSVARHQGHIIKTMGDGFLAEFDSVFGAVRCALDIQQGMVVRNTKYVEEYQILFRIGINIGDIMIESGDVFGTGVNVAARLETLAEPGGICLSRSTYDQVKHLLDVGFVYLGEHYLKNIPDPVYVYRVDLNTTPAARKENRDKPRILAIIGNKGAVGAITLAIFGLTAAVVVSSMTKREDDVAGNADTSPAPSTVATSVSTEIRPPPTGSLSPGDVFRDCRGCPEMVVVRPGAFVMGTLDGFDDERPLKNVTISKAFAVGKYEVTFDNWAACINGGGCSAYMPEDRGWGRGHRPVINVSWRDARTYVDWLSIRTGKNYRLLSEAEWEYVARAGSKKKYPWGLTIDPGKANYTNLNGTVPVSSYDANAFGLHNVIGNVAEWVEDCYQRDAYQSHEAYPAPVGGPEDSCRRVLRGGSWEIDMSDGYDLMRVTIRRSGDPSGRYSYNGLRVARTLD